MNTKTVLHLGSLLLSSKEPLGNIYVCCKHDLFSVRHQSGQCSTMLILSLCFDSFVTSVKRYIWKSMLSATNLHKLSITEHKVVLEWITINPC
jgi:hypothetical protein